MRIITKGVDPRNLIWQGKCNNCTAMVEATQDELSTHYDQRNRQDFGTAVCPCCSQPMHFYVRAQAPHYR